MTHTENITITVNGAEKNVPAGTTVTELIKMLGITAAMFAVERNKNVVKRADHATTTLEPGDTLQIVTFVGGG